MNRSPQHDDHFHGAAPGVAVTVDAEGGIVDLRFAQAGYRTMHSDDLGRAIVGAYRQAQLAATAAVAETQ
ncbi:MAG TPA: hypothetical protein VGM75_14560 [Pseudonocardiaceae bacterium]|jgi:hypothetical protein